MSTIERKYIIKPEKSSHSILRGSVLPPSGGCIDPLPCLYSNNSTETFPEEKNVPKEQLVQQFIDLLSPYYKKSAHTLYSNVSRLIELAPSINHIGFLTLTFSENVTDHKEAYNRFRSFNSHYLSKSEKFGEWIAVKERQKRGAWHYHLLVVLQDDIRTGVDFENFSKGNYRSAPESLRNLWTELRENLPKYRLGRSELLPIRTNSEAMARYIGKYISKHIGSRTLEDRGVRLVNYSKGWIKSSMKFAWFTENSKEWRRKVSLFAEYQGCSELYQLTEKLGSNWAYKYVEDIYNIDQILEEKAGQVQGEFKSETVKKAVSRKKAREQEKKFFKDERKFRDWEKEQIYRKRKRKARYETKGYLEVAKTNWKEDFQRKLKEVPF